VTGSVPGSPAAVLQAVLRQNPNAASTSYGPGVFTTASNLPHLPSLMDEVVLLPQNAYLDANVEIGGNLTVDGSLTASSTLYDSTVLADSPVLWWKLNETSGSTAADSSGNSHTGTYSSVTQGLWGPIIANASETSGQFASASSSKVTSSYNPSGFTALTVEAWVNQLGLGQPGGGNPRIADNSHTDSDNNGFQFFLMGSAGSYYPTLYVGNGSTNTNAATASVAVPAYGWGYVAGVWNGNGDGKARTYLNGILVGTSAGSVSTMSAGSGAGVVAGIGIPYNGDYFTGLIAQIAVYSTALSQARLIAHYQAGAYT